MKGKSFLAMCLFINLSLQNCDRSPVVANSDYVPSGYTEIGDTISGILTVEGSPYHITKNLYLDSLQTLHIEPGVQLFFDDSLHFFIRGKIECIGSHTDVIIFSAFENEWNGIEIVNSREENVFQFTIFEKVIIDYSDAQEYGSLIIVNSNITVTNSIFRNNNAYHGGAITLIKSASEIYNNIFFENKAVGWGGAILSIQSMNQIINNTFYKNFCVNYGGGIVAIKPEMEIIQNNIFYQNQGNSGDANMALRSGDPLLFNMLYNFPYSDFDNPGFISETDLHLQITSPCINNGNPHASFNDVDATRNDQGAYGGPLGDW